MRRIGEPRRAATLAVLTLLAGIATGCRDGANDARAEENAAQAVIVGAENMDVVRQDSIETGPVISGSLAAERAAQIRAEVAGPVVQMFVEEGQRVSKGTLLARIDDTSIRESLLSARSALTSAQTNADVARRELERAERLAQAGAIAERDVEQARRANTAAQSQLADAKARLSLAQGQLDDTQIRAPFGGTVSQRQVSAGDVVAPGAALFTVVDPSSMRLEASVQANQLAAVKVGAPVTFTVSGYPGRRFDGRITRVNPTADPVTRQVKILASIPNAGNSLVAGLFAEGRVATDTRWAPVVPLSAVNETGVVPMATRLRNGRAERVEIQLGLRDPAMERIEILAGLSPGDTVLLGAAQGISPGTPVRIGDPGSPSEDRSAAEELGARSQE